MLQNISPKTKLWLVISGSLLLLLLVTSIAMFGRGTLFKGYITETIGDFGVGLQDIPTTIYASGVEHVDTPLLQFSIVNNSSAAIDPVHFRISIVRTTGGIDFSEKLKLFVMTDAQATFAPSTITLDESNPANPIADISSADAAPIPIATGKTFRIAANLEPADYGLFQASLTHIIVGSTENQFTTIVGPPITVTEPPQETPIPLNIVSLSDLPSPIIAGAQDARLFGFTVTNNSASRNVFLNDFRIFKHPAADFPAANITDIKLVNVENPAFSFAAIPTGAAFDFDLQNNVEIQFGVSRTFYVTGDIAGTPTGGIMQFQIVTPPTFTPAVTFPSDNPFTNEGIFVGQAITVNPAPPPPPAGTVTAMPLEMACSAPFNIGTQTEACRFPLNVSRPVMRWKMTAAAATTPFHLKEVNFLILMDSNHKLTAGDIEEASLLKYEGAAQTESVVSSQVTFEDLNQTLTKGDATISIEEFALGIIHFSSLNEEVPVFPVEKIFALRLKLKNTAASNFFAAFLAEGSTQDSVTIPASMVLHETSTVDIINGQNDNLMSYFYTTVPVVKVTRIDLTELSYGLPPNDFMPLFSFEAENLGPETATINEITLRLASGAPSNLVTNEASLKLFEAGGTTPSGTATLATDNTITVTGINKDIFANQKKTFVLKGKFNAVGSASDYKVDLITTTVSPTKFITFSTIPQTFTAGLLEGQTIHFSYQQTVTIAATKTEIPAANIAPSTETNVLKFKATSDTTSLNLNQFTLQLTSDATTPVGDFQEFKLVEEASSGNIPIATFDATPGSDELAAFRSSTDKSLVITLPNDRQTLTAGITGRTFILSTKLVSNATTGTSFKVKLPGSGIQTSIPAATTVQFSGLPLESSIFTIPAPALPNPPVPLGPSAEVLALQNSIASLQRQIQEAGQAGNNQGVQALTSLVQSLLAQQNTLAQGLASGAASGGAVGTGGTPSTSGLASGGASGTGTGSGSGARSGEARTGAERGTRSLSLADTEEEIEALREGHPLGPASMAAPAPVVQPQAQQFYGAAPQGFTGAAGAGFTGQLPFPTGFQPTLVSSPRLRAAPERGQTGPGLLAYLPIVGASQLFYFLRRRKKKK